MAQRVVDHDTYVHTVLAACCADLESVPEKIVARAGVA